MSDTLSPELLRAARSAACRFYDGAISSADAGREFAAIANSGWHGEPLNALHAEFDAAVERLIEAAAEYPEAARAAHEGREMNSDEQRADRARRLDSARRCSFRDCERAARKGWTMCGRHYSAGRALDTRDAR